MVMGLLAHTGSLFLEASARNVSGTSENRPDDVELVRFGYIMLRDNSEVNVRSVRCPEGGLPVDHSDGVPR